jgi:predicted site-specific integrase-resolvase
MKVKLTQYAKMTGVSVRTLWRRINDGSLTVVKSKTGRVFVEIDEEVKPYKLNVVCLCKSFIIKN